MESQYWQYREVSIHYVQLGSNPDYPPLLLVHGFGASTDHWRKNITELGQELEVWAIDLLGFGRSQKPRWRYSADLWRDQLLNFIKEKIQRPTILVGNSLGGYVSLCCAADAKEWVAGVILLNSAGAFSDSTPLGAQPPSPWTKLLRSAIRALLQQSWFSYLLFQFVRQKSQIRKTLLQVYVDKSAVTEQLVEEIYRPSCDPGAAHVFASVFTSRQGRTVDQLLQTIDCPLLAIWGTGDPWMDCATRSQKFRTYYPDLQEVFLPAGHCPHDEAPKAVNEAIRSWLRTCVRGCTVP
ncbi:MAG: alpha/beta fold hydrolase [Pseudanabaenaceae cyanobacterium SKYGB_i_bin29]|nr:alpha/beta fold hydrolase [Pseudanabaenaceae cyanobacterium SKYG29]MDW8421255.1 alpha/beta fold hydrolase [Pseudanabaenaceae cyanobacterium SKYGB_i_bin29]